jgi:hypothetical protein
MACRHGEQSSCHDGVRGDLSRAVHRREAQLADFSGSGLEASPTPGMLPGESLPELQVFGGRVRKIA